MLSKNYFFKLIFPLEEYNIVMQHFEDSFPVEKPLNLQLKVTLLNFSPIEKRLSAQVPGNAVEEINQVSRIE